mgnify:CR=1 FL=1
MTSEATAARERLVAAYEFARLRTAAVEDLAGRMPRICLTDTMRHRLVECGRNEEVARRVIDDWDIAHKEGGQT